MNLLSWKNTYASDDELANQQHALLLEAINALFAAKSCNGNKEQVVLCFDRLIEIARKHFYQEESWVEKVGGDGLMTIRVQHHRQLAQILEYARREQRSNHAPMDSLVSFLQNWFQQHVQGTGVTLALAA